MRSQFSLLLLLLTGLASSQLHGQTAPTTLYSIDWEQDQLVTIDIATSEIVEIGSLGMDIQRPEEISFADGFLYVTHKPLGFPYPSELVMVDPFSGVALSSTPMTQTGTPVAAEAVASLNGELWVGHPTSLSSYFSDQLGVLDFNGNIVNDTNFNSIAADFDCLAFDPQGQLWALDSISPGIESHLYFMGNPGAFTYSLVGISTHSPSRAIHDIEFLEDGRLLGLDFLHSTIQEIDPSTGGFTLLADFSAEDRNLDGLATPSDLTLVSINQLISGQTSTLTFRGTNPGARITVVYGRSPGSTTIPGCGNAQVEIANAQIAGSVFADSFGTGSLSMPLPISASGLTVLVQCVDAAGCDTSNLVTVTIS
ncbi:MAG: hypothetical protein HQ519_03470 [Planctomycetes bacterium]|nr:hypothetical protein [Planctomycetota bacterium]